MIPSQNHQEEAEDRFARGRDLASCSGNPDRRIPRRGRNLVIPKEYDDDHLKGRSGIIHHRIGRDVILAWFAVIVASSDDHGCSVAVVV